MTTRLTRNELKEIQTNLLGILDSGIKFIECPISDDDKSIFWHKAFPDDLLDAYTTLNEHGVAVEYAATTRSIGFVIPNTAEEAFAVRLCLTDSQRGFFTITQKMMEDWNTIKLADDESVQWPLLSREQIVDRMGKENAELFFEWVKTCAIMDDELYNARTVIEELFGMCKTAGQISRMMPDLLQYVPKEKRAALENQRRASGMPFEWAAYDRATVEKMLGTLHKCFLLKGLEKPSMSNASAESDAFSWATSRKILVEEDEPEDA
jgi:hypothetical protein